MKKAILILLGVFVVALFAIGFSGKITGNAFAYNLQRSCTETDGNDPYLQGSVEFKDRTSVKPQSAADTCVNAGNLLEHYCDNIAHLTRTIPCDCKDGACVKY